jgi:hypothetical protein
MSLLVNPGSRYPEKMLNGPSDLAVEADVTKAASGTVGAPTNLPPRCATGSRPGIDSAASIFDDTEQPKR